MNVTPFVSSQRGVEDYLDSNRFVGNLEKSSLATLDVADISIPLKSIFVECKKGITDYSDTSLKLRAFQKMCDALFFRVRSVDPSVFFAYLQKSAGLLEGDDLFESSIDYYEMKFFTLIYETPFFRDQNEFFDFWCNSYKILGVSESDYRQTLTHDFLFYLGNAVVEPCQWPQVKNALSWCELTIGEINEKENFRFTFLKAYSNLFLQNLDDKRAYTDYMLLVGGISELWFVQFVNTYVDFNQRTYFFESSIEYLLERMVVNSQYLTYLTTILNLRAARSAPSSKLAQYFFYRALEVSGDLKKSPNEELIKRFRDCFLYAPLGLTHQIEGLVAVFRQFNLNINDKINLLKVVWEHFLGRPYLIKKIWKVYLNCS